MTTIGGYCLFDHNACSACPTSYIRKTPNSNSCECIRTGFLPKYSYGDTNTPTSSIIFDRSEARRLFSGPDPILELNTLNPNIQGTSANFDSIWPLSSTNIVMIVSYWCCNMGITGNYYTVKGFFNYSLNGNTITISEITNNALGDVGIIDVPSTVNLPRSFTINTDKSQITWFRDRVFK